MVTSPGSVNAIMAAYGGRPRVHRAETARAHFIRLSLSDCPLTFEPRHAAFVFQLSPLVPAPVSVEKRPHWPGLPRRQLALLGQARIYGFRNRPGREGV